MSDLLPFILLLPKTLLKKQSFCKKSGLISNIIGQSHSKKNKREQKFEEPQ